MHGQREDVRVGAADVAVQREVALVGARPWRRRATRRGGRSRRAGPCCRCRRASIRAWSRSALVERLEPDDGLADLAVDVADGLLDALAAVAVAAVAQLDRLVGAGAGPARDRGAAAGAGEQLDLDLDGRVAARIEDLPRR